MKKLSLLIQFIIAGNFFCHAQIENLIVETYYIADSLDATDTAGNIPLEAGTRTYRIYLDLAPGSKIRKLYGDTNHTIRIESTGIFYNNLDRDYDYFGYLMRRTDFQSNPSIALDSWLTLGNAVRPFGANPKCSGVLKSHDTDGSFSFLANNSGGTAGISNGILKNNDSQLGEPIYVSDGYMPDTSTLGQWLDYGFIDFFGTQYDTTVFGTLKTGTVFISNNAYLQQNSGISGVNADNMVLLAQLTTNGEISFELNVEIEQPGGTIVQYVADDSVLLSGFINGQYYNEHLSPFLKYPPLCGCRDKNYIEYSDAYACSIPDSCKTLIRFGCMDSSACNFDPLANYNIQELCCYPGYCNDRDLEVVCPQLSAERLAVFPNPAKDFITVSMENTEAGLIYLRVINSYAQIIFNSDYEITGNKFLTEIDLSDQPAGIYYIQIISNSTRQLKKIFTKN